jgi:signal transduction histidine kinase
MIRDLHRGFSQLDRQMDLLRAVDRTILGHERSVAQRPIEQLFLDSLNEFIDIHQTRAKLHCYVYLGTEFALLQTADAQPTSPQRIPVSSAFGPFLANSNGNTQTEPILIHDAEDPLYTHFEGARAILLCPMYLSPGKLLCAFILWDPNPLEVSRLRDPDFIRSFTALVQQLSIAYSSYDRVLQHQRIQKLWDTFVSLELSPTSCFDHLAKAVPSFLPTFGPIKFSGDLPQVQVLTLARGPVTKEPTHLVIRGTTGEEHEGTRIAIGASICGWLVTKNEDELPYFCNDPTKSEFEDRYKSYLGQEGKQIRTELAVRLIRDQTLVGILNLESDMPDAFNKHHIDAVLNLSKVVAPIVAVFDRRLEMNTLMQASVTSSTARYLEGLAGVFGHASGTPLSSLKSNIELATDLLNKDVKAELHHAESAATEKKEQELKSAFTSLDAKVDKTEGALKRLLAIHAQISTYTRDFVRDINSYAKSGRLDLRELVQSAIDLANSGLIAKSGRNIRIEFEKKDLKKAPIVFCSTLLKQHLYSILHNSILSIENRYSRNPSPGLLRVDIYKFTPPAAQEVKLNESWALRIWDNGSGVSAEQLEKLRRFQPGTRFQDRPGHGYGLTAAQRYVASIDGRIELNAQLYEFFEVTMHFPLLPDEQSIAVLSESEP